MGDSPRVFNSPRPFMVWAWFFYALSSESLHIISYVGISATNNLKKRKKSYFCYFHIRATLRKTKKQELERWRQGP